MNGKFPKRWILPTAAGIFAALVILTACASLLASVLVK